MTDYSFVTIWRIEAPIESVWDALNHSERMPEWWKYVESVTELEPGDENGLGKRDHITWTSALPYKLSFDMRVTQVRKPHVLELAATGELDGTGRWQLSQDGSVTTVRYDWNVITTKRWMNALSPLLRPVFAWNHDILMSEGGKGLARLLRARLLPATEQRETRLPRLRLVFVAGIAVTTVAMMGYAIWAFRRK